METDFKIREVLVYNQLKSLINLTKLIAKTGKH